MLRYLPLAGLPMLLISSVTVSAQVDPYHVTAAEHAACDSDARFLCGSSTTEDQLLACMKQQRSKLTAVCRPVFDAGLKKRGLM